jgi:hypothetical protein
MMGRTPVPVFDQPGTRPIAGAKSGARTTAHPLASVPATPAATLVMFPAPGAESAGFAGSPIRGRDVFNVGYDQTRRCGAVVVVNDGDHAPNGSVLYAAMMALRFMCSPVAVTPPSWTDAFPTMRTAS